MDERFPRFDSSKIHSLWPDWQRLQGGPFSAPTHFIFRRRQTVHALRKECQWGREQTRTTDLEPLVGLTLPVGSLSAPGLCSAPSSSFFCFFLFCAPAAAGRFPFMLDDSATGLGTDSESSEGDECIVGCCWGCCCWR